MGYTHYWYIESELDKTKFKSFSNDCKKLFDYSRNILNIELADGSGENEPLIDEDFISFNGSEKQPLGVWTSNEDISIPWPSNNAGLNSLNADPIAEKVSGTWFAGHLLSQRTAPVNSNGFGSGSYESCVIERLTESRDKYDGYSFNCCKTAYRPYDLIVTAVLIALKHHFPKTFIKSDGEYKDWADGIYLCDKLFGYGLDFSFDEGYPPEKKPEPIKRLPVQNKKKITLATVKSFVKKNKGKLYINVLSSFDGMTDCISTLDGKFTKVTEEDRHYENTLGVPGAWFVRGSRDRFSYFETETLTGFEVWNCCGSFILAVKKS